jgi:membrane protease YdiL (CAAX protease family)
MTKTTSWIQEKLISNRACIAIELIIIVTLFAANQFGIIRVPLSLTLPLLLLGWISLRLRGFRWRDIGLYAPDNWKKTILLAIVIATVHQLISTFVLIPLLEQVIRHPIDLSIVEQIKGNLVMLGVGIVIAWVLAAFGEEMVYRGYIFNRFADILNPLPVRWVVGFIISALLFAWVHQYQGIIGVIDSFIGAAIWSGLYFYSGRNLWMPIIAHGFYDTIAFIFAYFGIIG